MRKMAMIAAVLALLILAVAGCGSNSPAASSPAAVSASTAAASSAASASTAAASATTPESQKLTLEQLKEYNGQNGKPAYVAVDGVIYDVTNVPEWKGGQHNGYSAGQDLTDIIKNKSPHGVSKLQGVPVVGTLVK